MTTDGGWCSSVVLFILFAQSFFKYADRRWGKRDSVSGMELHHYYHVYADGDWHQSVSDHMHALLTSGLLDHFGTIQRRDRR